MTDILRSYGIDAAGNAVPIASGCGIAADSQKLGGMLPSEFAKADEVGITMELLWENASPTSDFAAQSIAIETDSEYLLIEHTSNSGGNYGVALVRKNKTTRISYVVNDSWGLYSMSRGASFDGEKVTFGVGSSYMYANSKHTLAEHNTNCVPNRILALKVVTK